ncbi:arginine--tRNA ligase [Candidatus Dependentiae bacterium]|nr:arginine--tRNA ligase [Candidatus Dependentiae bacterium]
MNVIEHIQHAYHHYLATTFQLSEQDLAVHVVELNVDENRQQFGDLSNASAMILAKQLQKNPRDIASQITREFKYHYIARVDVAGPGFLNFSLTAEAFKQLAVDLQKQTDNFFKLSTHVPKKLFNIEFVSANPTGPLHLGHGRGGIIGDVLSAVLRYIGHEVTKEFYINDAGAQIQKLGKSFKIRCKQVLGYEEELPEDAYHGEYLIELAHKAFKAYADELLDKDDNFYAEYAKDHMLEDLKKTLKEYGIGYDTWFSEKILHTGGAIERALQFLQERNHLYVKDGATWFKSTQYGDDKDRVVKKESGELTYVAADIAYLQNKVERGAGHLIMILGHDHHSYETRLHAVRKALGIEQSLDVILYQLVKMKAAGKQVRMSKRAGNIVTLRDVVETVGTDVARFFYLNRKADAQLEFDLELALKTTEENPVFYVQYAYVRIHSILEKAAQESAFSNITQEDIQNIGQEEHYLIKKMVSLKELLFSISTNFHTHLLANYTIELANAFHRYYAQSRVLDIEDVPKSRARVAMLYLLQQHVARCLNLLGLSKPTKM